MYLMRAECNSILGTAMGESPAAEYNKVHNRGGLDAVSSVSLSASLRERRRALAHEDFIIHGLKRLNKDVGSKKYNDTKLIFPITLREIKANKIYFKKMAIRNSNSHNMSSKKKVLFIMTSSFIFVQRK